MNSFYLQKEAEFKVRARSLVDKKRILMARQGPQANASLMSLKEAFLEFQQDLTKLGVSKPRLPRHRHRLVCVMLLLPSLTRRQYAL